MNDMAYGRTHIAPSRDELDAAARLGAVFRELTRRGEKSLGPWAVMPDKGYGPNFLTLNIVLGVVYGTDPSVGENRASTRPGFRSTRRTATVMRLVVDSTLQFAVIGLNAEIVALRKLYERLTSEGGIADRLHRESSDLVAAFEREKRKTEAIRVGEAPPQDSERLQRQRGFSYLTQREIDEIFRDKVAPLAAYAGHDVLSILAAHPQGRQIIAAYAQSAGQGTIASSRRVLDAIGAVVKFTQTAVNERRALRYPFFVPAVIPED